MSATAASADGWLSTQQRQTAIHALGSKSTRSIRAPAYTVTLYEYTAPAARWISTRPVHDDDPAATRQWIGAFTLNSRTTTTTVHVCQSPTDGTLHYYSPMYRDVLPHGAESANAVDGGDADDDAARAARWIVEPAMPRGASTAPPVRELLFQTACTTWTKWLDTTLTTLSHQHGKVDAVIDNVALLRDGSPRSLQLLRTLLSHAAELVGELLSLTPRPAIARLSAASATAATTTDSAGTAAELQQQQVRDHVQFATDLMQSTLLVLLHRLPHWLQLHVYMPSSIAPSKTAMEHDLNRCTTRMRSLALEVGALRNHTLPIWGIWQRTIAVDCASPTDPWVETFDAIHANGTIATLTRTRPISSRSAGVCTDDDGRVVRTTTNVKRMRRMHPQDTSARTHQLASLLAQLLGGLWLGVGIADSTLPGE